MFSSSKPHSAITVLVDRLTSESYEVEDLSGIPELIEVIDLQKATGPTEAARALRKKLKYGNVHRQLRALVLLNSILENGTPRIQRNLFDEMLLERLRVCAASEVSDEKVKRLCRNLFISWAKNYQGRQGLQNVVALHKELPRRKQLPNKENARKELVDPFKGEEDEEQQQQQPMVSASTKIQDTHGHRTRPGSSGIKSSFFGSSDVSRSKDKKKGKSEPVSAMQMSTAAGEGLTASAILQNMLRSHNREEQRISENESIAKQYKHCWNIRRRVLRYIGANPDAEIMGALLDSHDKLIEAILNYKHSDQALDDDSDSEDELAEQQHMFRMAEERAANEKRKMSVDSPVGAPSLPVAPPRPAPQAAQPESEEEEDDDDNPFADSNRIDTPSAERPEPKW